MIELYYVFWHFDSISFTFFEYLLCAKLSAKLWGIAIAKTAKTWWLQGFWLAC